jgi:uncharacterized protein (TIGR03437 family)
MKPASTSKPPRRARTNRPTGVAIGHTILIALAAFQLHAQNAGAIISHQIPEMGPAIIDSQQNVYIGGGGGCAGGYGFGSPFTCYPMVIAKANASGSAVFSFSDSTPDRSPRGLAVDSAGEVFMTGVTLSTGGFAAKLSADGGKYLYFTQLPSALLSPAAVQIDSQGNAYIAGMTSDFHPFVTKLSADGLTFVYTTKFSGSAASSANPDSAVALAVDASGDAIVTGWTNSSDFAITPGVVQPSFAGPTDAFIAKLDSSGNIVFSTFLGGAGGAWGQAIQLDSAGNIYVAGVAGVGFPTTPGTYQAAPIMPLWSLGTTGFLAKVTPNAGAIAWSTYTVSNGIPPTETLPTSDPIQLLVSSSGDVYLATGTRAGFVSTSSAPQPCYSGGNSDTVVLHLAAQGALADSTYLGAQFTPFGMGLPGDGSVLVATATIDPTSLNYLPLVDQVTFGQPGWTAPACLSPAILNSANFTAGMSPGELVSLIGFGIGPQTGVVYTPGAQGQVPTSLGGVTLTFNGILAPLTYVQSRQVNAQVPFEVTGPTVAMTLTYGGATFGPIVEQLDSGFADQGIFRLHPGVDTQAAATNEDGSVNGPGNPAAPGSIVTLYGNGYGPLVQSCATGGLNAPGPVSLYYTGAAATAPNFTPAVQYEGGAPGLLCGIDQFNIVVPANSSSGELLLTVDAGGQYNGSTIFVK